MAGTQSPVSESRFVNEPIKEKWLLVFRPWDLDRKELLREELACDNWDDCQFPYPHYNDYLQKRGLNHLLDWAAWTESADHRTKNYINRLKIRLRLHHPDKCASIVRNEAHVRLATSTWYVSGALLVISSMGLVCLFILIGLRIRPQMPAYSSGVLIGDFLSSISCCLAVYAFALYARISIARFLHYRRMREVYYVLETALTALHTPPGAARAKAYAKAHAKTA